MYLSIMSLSSCFVLCLRSIVLCIISFSFSFALCFHKQHALSLEAHLVGACGVPILLHNKRIGGVLLLTKHNNKRKKGEEKKFIREENAQRKP